MANLSVTAKSLNAKTRTELSFALVMYQMKFSRAVKIINIHPDPEGGYTAWFYDEADKLPSVTELMKK